MRKTTAPHPASLALAAAAAAPTRRARRAATHALCPKAWQASWQKLANRIHAPVYCPGWLPDPLTGQIGGRWNNIDSVSKDRSYLIGFVWQENGPGDPHQPARLSRPDEGPDLPRRRARRRQEARHVRAVLRRPARRRRRSAASGSTEYTVNQDADQWHVLYAWRHEGSLYTLSQHVAPPLTFPRSSANLNRSSRRSSWSRPASDDAPDPEAAARGRRAARRSARPASTSSSTSSRVAQGPPAAGGLTPEQHLLQGVRIVEDNERRGRRAAAPPPARDRDAWRRRAQGELADAPGRRWSSARRRSTRGYEPTPAGLGVTVAWGLPYFRRYVPEARRRAHPGRPARDRRRRASRSVLLDSIRFPSDPAETILEENDVAVLLRSDRLDHIADGAKALFQDSASSSRRASARASPAAASTAARACRSRWRWRRRCRGAYLIPDGAELFLGFTSTQKAGLGPPQDREPRGARLHSPGGYFAQGTHLARSRTSPRTSRPGT